MRLSPRSSIGTASGFSRYPGWPSTVSALISPLSFTRSTALRVLAALTSTASMSVIRSATVAHPPISRRCAPMMVRSNEVALPDRESKSSRIIARSLGHRASDGVYSEVHFAKTGGQWGQSEPQPVGPAEVGDDALPPQFCVDLLEAVMIDGHVTASLPRRAR